MNKIVFGGRSVRDLLVAFGPVILVAVLGVALCYKYLDPAPPRFLRIAVGMGEGDYLRAAKKYKDFFAGEGIEVELKQTSGPMENLSLLQDEDASVDIGFVQDGVGSNEKHPDLVSLGSLYYEPVWIFSRVGEIRRLNQLIGKKISIGKDSSGTHSLAKLLLNGAGITHENAQLISEESEHGIAALKNGSVDAIFLMMPPESPYIHDLMHDWSLKLANLEHAEAISRVYPALHHLELPKGAMDLMQDIPSEKIHLVAPTATLVVRDDLHPSISFLLLKAAKVFHSNSGILNKKNEFPSDKDGSFQLSEVAEKFYKEGGPFWHRVLPFWIASLADRFFLILIPLLAIIVPAVRLIHPIYNWRVKTKIYKKYGELKFLEMGIKKAVEKNGADESLDSLLDYMKKLDSIEDKVSNLKVPVAFTEYVYLLRGHIDFVRERLNKTIANFKG